MSLYVIISNTDPDYLLLKNLLANHPALKDGFTLKEILRISPILLNERKTLKKMFDGRYTAVLTHSLHFEYQKEKWRTEEIDIEKGFHQFIIKVLNHALKEGRFVLGSQVLTGDAGLIEFLTIKQQEVYDKDVGDTDREETLYPMDQEMMNFISTGLKDKLGRVSHFDYWLVKVFLEILGEYEEMLMMREFG